MAILDDESGSDLQDESGSDILDEGTTSNAAIFPAVINAVTSIPLPTVKNTAAVLEEAGSAFLDESGNAVLDESDSGNAFVTPAVVNASTLLPAQTVKAGAKAAPAVVQAVTSIPTPTIAAVVTAAVTPAVVLAVTSTPAPTVGAGVSATALPAVANASASFGTDTLVTGGIATPAVIQAVSTIPTPTITAGGGINVSPGVPNAVTSIPTPTVAAGAVAAPSVLSAVTSIPLPTLAVTLVNTLEGGTSGTTITAGNSGGGSGNAFAFINAGTGATITYDNTHAAHGSLSSKITTGSTSAVVSIDWSTFGAAPFMTSCPQWWFREYLYFTAIPSTDVAIFQANQGSSTHVASFFISGVTGLIRGQDAAFNNVLVTTTAIPVNKWFRIEGYVIGSATSGQLQLRVYDNMDSLTFTEQQTTAATLNTVGLFNQAYFGMTNSVANIGPFWVDDLATSNTGYVGPAYGYVAPSVVQAVTSIPTPTITAIVTASVTPAVVQAVTSIPTQTVKAGAVATPAVVAATASTPAPAVITYASVTPSAINAVTSIPTPTIAAGAVAAPNRVSANTSIPAPTITALLTLVNSFEGGTSGTTITTGNSGGTSGNAFGFVATGIGTTVAYDNTRAAHGTLSAQLAIGTTGAAVSVDYIASAVGPNTQLWFRQYLYFTALPSVDTGLFMVTEGAGNHACTFYIQGANGLIRGQDSAYSNVLVTANAIPVGQWFRIEGYVIGSATTGQLQLQVYDSMDALIYTEQQTTAATLNTYGYINEAYFGITTGTANSGPYWMDDVAVSNNGYVGPSAAGPVVIAASATIFTPTITNEFGVNITPAVINATASFDADSITISALATPLAVSGTLSIPSPGIIVTSKVTPGVVSSVTSIPTPGISTGARATPAVVGVSATIPTPGIVESEVIGTIAINAVTAIPTPTVTAGGNQNINASIINTVTTIPTPTITAVVSASVTPSVINSATAIPSTGAGASAKATPAVIQAVSTIPTSSITVSSIVLPAAITATSAIPTPTILSILSAVVLPFTIDATTSVRVPGITKQLTFANASVSSGSAARALVSTGVAATSNVSSL